VGLISVPISSVLASKYHSQGFADAGAIDAGLCPLDDCFDLSVLAGLDFCFLSPCLRITYCNATDLFLISTEPLWDFDRNSREALAEIFLEFAAPPIAGRLLLRQFIAVYEVENERCWKAYREGTLTQQEASSIAVQTFR